MIRRSKGNSFLNPGNIFIIVTQKQLLSTSIIIISIALHIFRNNMLLPAGIPHTRR